MSLARRMGGAGIRRGLRAPVPFLFDPLTGRGIRRAYLGDQGKTILSGEVDVWADLISSLDASAQVSTERPEESLADSDMGGQDVLQFNAATSDRLRLAVAGQDYLFDGLGGTWILVYWTDSEDVNDLIMDSTNSSNNAIGHRLIHKNPNVQGLGGNGAAILFNTDNLAAALSTPHIYIHRYEEDGGAGDEIDVRIDGTTKHQQASAVAPGSGPSAQPHAFGDRSDGAGAVAFDGKIAAYFDFDVRLTDAEVAAYEAFSTKYAVVLP